VWLIVRTVRFSFSDDLDLTSIRVLASRITTKKVPALTLVVVGIIGMVAGVLAATITVTTNSYTGEIGTLHNTTSGFTVTDNGLGVVANTAAANYVNNTQIGTSGTQLFNGNAVTQGDWVESLTFSTSLTDASSHKVSVTIKNGTGTTGNATPVTFGSTSTFMKTMTGAGSGTVTLYFDIGASIATPITVYVNVT
jgi:hypothetical protein